MAMGELHINHLPEELITYIFSFLPLRDRKNVRMVCKSWHRISYSLRLISKDVTVIRQYINLGEVWNRTTRHVNVKGDLSSGIYQDKNICEDQAAAKFWEDQGPFIKSLDITCACHFFGILPHVFTNCPNLESLCVNLSAGDDDDEKSSRSIRPVAKVAKFPKLTSLTLHGEPAVVSPLLANIGKHTSHLKKIGLFCDCDHLPQPIVETLISIIKKQNSLKELDISNNELCDSFIHNVTDYISPQLNRLNISGCEMLTDHSLIIIADRLPELKELFFGMCYFTPESYMAAFLNLTNLSVVSLNGSADLTDNHVSAMAALLELTHLDISDCCLVSNRGLLQLFGSVVRSQMVELRLANLDKITDKSIMAIMPNMPNLHTLNLRGCVKVSNRSLKIIFSNNLSLRCFTIGGCSKMNDFKIGPSINALKELRHLDISRVSKKMLTTLRFLELPYLEGIDACLSVPQDVVSEVSKKCPSLKYLDWWCHHGSRIFKIGRRERLYLKCRTSPFGTCSDPGVCFKVSF